MQRSNKNTNTQITFRAREEDRRHLRLLAARANCSQAELILKLLYDYGETVVRQMESNNFTPESGLPEEPKLILCWLTDGEWITRSAWFTSEELESEQVKAYDQTGGNLWWMQSEKEPDLPRAYGFYHIQRVS